MKFLSKCYLGIIFVFLYAPIIVMIAFSFNASKSRSVWSGFTFEWYSKLFNDESIIDEIFESKSRKNAGMTMPPEGLCLKAVFY